MRVKRRFSTRWGHPYHLQGACATCRQTLLCPLCFIPSMIPESYMEWPAQSKGEDPFEEILDQAIAMLQRRGRVSYRTLTLQFHLDEESLAALKEELIEVHHLAVDHEGRMLVWAGEARTTSAPSPPPPQQARRQADPPAR